MSHLDSFRVNDRDSSFGYYKSKIVLLILNLIHLKKILVLKKSLLLFLNKWSMHIIENL